MGFGEAGGRLDPKSAISDPTLQTKNKYIYIGIYMYIYIYIYWDLWGLVPRPNFGSFWCVSPFREVASYELIGSGATDVTKPYEVV